MSTCLNIVDYLDKHPNDEFTPKQLAFNLRLNHNTVKSCCFRLFKNGKITKSHRGYYRSVIAIFKIDNEGIFYTDILLHGIKIEYRGELCNYIYTTPYLIGYNFTIHRHRINKAPTLSEEWEGRIIKITAHKSLIEIWLKSSNKPLNHEEFINFNHYLRGKFPQILPTQWTIKQLDIGTDTPLLHLKGISEMTLKVFNNLWLSIYQKFDKVRIEARTTQNISFEDCLNTFGRFLNTLKGVEYK